MHAGQVVEHGEYRYAAGKAAEYGCGEVMPFEATERE